MDQRPADLPVATDGLEALAQLADRFVEGSPATPGSMATGGADGSAKVTNVAAAYSTATMARTNDGPAIATINGPRKAKPTANEACSVMLNTPIAVSSCGFGTIRGIIDASAGVRTTVVRLIPR